MGGKTGLMGTFGENLRREREMRGITLQEISAATKISVNFLKSLENEEFSRLPGGIFNRGFVRAYARYLGLDEDPLIEEYLLAAKPKGDIDLSQFSPPRTYSRPERSTRRTLWVAIIVVVLLSLGFTLWKHSHQPLQVPSTPNGSPAGNHPTNSSSGPPEAAGRSAQTANNKPAGGGVLAATATVTPAAPKLPTVTDADGKLVLQIAATERSWVAIDADGNTVMQGVMDPNTVKTFKADTFFDVLTGNAQGVILTLNGQVQKPLGREGEVKQVHLTWKSLKNQTAE
jgi:cytoskeleton protein RodZ